MELPPPELHEMLTQKVAFSPKQRQAALAYRNHLLSRMGATLRQRRDISLQLLRTLGVQEPSPNKQVMTAASCLAAAKMHRRLDFSAKYILTRLCTHWLHMGDVPKALKLDTVSAAGMSCASKQLQETWS